MTLNMHMTGMSYEDYLRKVSASGLKAPTLDQDKMVPDTSGGSWNKALQTRMVTNELKRIGMSQDREFLWPMQWVNNVCTGEQLDLYRVNREMKRNPTSGEEEKNGNYGRWYVAKRVPVMHNGQPVLNAEGYPETRLDGFTWFDKTLYVQSGAFHATAQPDLVDLMMYTYGPRVHQGQVDLWPSDAHMQAIVDGETFRPIISNGSNTNTSGGDQRNRKSGHAARRGLA